MLGASFVKTGGIALGRSTMGFALTGVAMLQFLTMLGLTLIALGALIVRRGRGASLGDASFD